MPAEGGEVRTIVEGEPEGTAAPCRAGAFIGGWSPDDESITYYSASVTQDVAQVCTVPFEGGEPEVIVNEPGVFSVEPVFSPTGATSPTVPSPAASTTSGSSISIPAIATT